MSRRKTAYRNILLPVDGSAPSRRATRQAVLLARRLKATIIAVHVITPFEAYAYGEALPVVITLPDFEKHARKSAERILAAASKAAGRVPCHCHTVWGMSAADAVVQAARQHRCDLIVMATHGRRGLERLLLGSVTQTVLAKSPVPVVVCR